MWGCGRSPQSHIYLSLLLADTFFRALIKWDRFFKQKRGEEHSELFIKF